MESSRQSGRIMMMIIMGVLFLTMLVLVVFAASSYRSSVRMQERSNDLRAAVGYVVTAVRTNGTDDIRLEEIDGVNTLVITDSISGLEQRIYHKDGDIIENYGATGYPFPEDTASVIGHADIFDMRIENDSLLVIDTDYGSSNVRIKR